MTAGSRATCARSGDAWVTCELGHRHWGRYGAAGLLLVADGHVLLQLRAGWSHHGGTWGIPGGALARAEPVVDGALREAAEEAGVVVPDSAATALSVDAHGGWSYATVLALASERRAARPTDAESDELRWVPLADVRALPLHPGFAASWPTLAPAAGRRLRLVVDAANVVGARPDGWWRDRAGAATRLRDALARLRISGGELPEGVGLPALTAWLPEVVLVVEGAARRVAAAPGGPVVVAALAVGDDEVVRHAGVQDGVTTTVVVSSDRELQSRVRDVGAVPVGAGWLLHLLPRVEAEPQPRTNGHSDDPGDVR